MKKILSILLVTYTLSASAQWISWRHEEDQNNNCDLKEVSYPSIDMTGRGSKVLARLNFIYNEKGRYLGLLVDKKSKDCEPKGFILSGHVKIQDLPKVVETNAVKATFNFNDAYQDAKEKAPDHLILDFANRVPLILEVSGVNADENRGLMAKYQYARKEATGAMDYRMHLPKANGFILIDSVLYNGFDAGNYIWGAGMRRLGFSYLEVKVGSELNGAFRTRSQNEQGHGVILSGDSNKDQRAIKAGYHSSYAKVDYKDYIAKLRVSVLTHGPDFEMLKHMFLNKVELQTDVVTILSLFKYKDILEKDLIELSSGMVFFRWKKYSPKQQVALLEALILSPKAGRTLLDHCRQQILKSDFDAVVSSRLLDMINKKS
jgi:hypothetical protein